MRFALAVVSVLLALPAAAAERTFQLTLPASQIDSIGQALAELPWKTANPIIAAIQQQIAAQQAPPPPAAPTPAPPSPPKPTSDEGN